LCRAPRRGTFGRAPFALHPEERSSRARLLKEPRWNGAVWLRRFVKQALHELPTGPGGRSTSKKDRSDGLVQWQLQEVTLSSLAQGGGEVCSLLVTSPAFYLARGGDSCAAIWGSAPWLLHEKVCANFTHVHQVACKYRIVATFPLICPFFHVHTKFRPKKHQRVSKLREHVILYYGR
jgi:hypothetical protein